MTLDPFGEATEALVEAHEREPDEDSWGFCAQGPDGAATFCWFADREELLDFLDLHGPYLHATAPPPTADARLRLRAALAGLRAAAPDADHARRALNAALPGGPQILWLGAFPALCGAGDGFAQGVRRAFRGTGPAPAPPLAPAERADFLEWLRGYVG